MFHKTNEFKMRKWREFNLLEKFLIFLLMVFAGLLLLTAIFAPKSFGADVNPVTRILPPHRITCDPLDATAVKGIYLYWRGSGAVAFNPANKIPITVDANHNPPIFDLLALKLACGDYEFAATSYIADGSQSGFSNVVSYSYVYPWCPRVPAGEEPIADHLNRIEAMIRAILLGMAAP